MKRTRHEERLKRGGYYAVMDGDGCFWGSNGWHYIPDRADIWYEGTHAFEEASFEALKAKELTGRTAYVIWVFSEFAPRQMFPKGITLADEGLSPRVYSCDEEESNV